MTMPRPLKPGEFYCHKCGNFVPLEKHQEHNQQHAKQQK